MPLSLGKYMTFYKTYVGAQRYLSTHDLDVKTLSRAFSNLPQLETFCLDVWNYHTGSRELTGTFGSFRCDQLLTADGGYVLPVVIRALSQSRIKIKVFELGRNFHDETDGHELGHAHYPSSLSASDRESDSCYTKNRLRAIYPERLSPGALKRNFRHPNGEIGRTAASSEIREFRIGQTFVERRDDLNDRRKITNSIANILNYAPLLVTILLGEIDNSVFGSAPNPLLSDVDTGIVLRHLRKLELHDYYAHEPSILTFLFRHMATLEEVKISFMDIEDSDFSAVLTRLRHTEFPKLKVFVLTFCEDIEMDLEVQDYLLRRTDKDPVAEYWRIQRLSRQR